MTYIISTAKKQITGKSNNKINPLFHKSNLRLYVHDSLFYGAAFYFRIRVDKSSTGFLSPATFISSNLFGGCGASLATALILLCAANCIYDFIIIIIFCVLLKVKKNAQTSFFAPRRFFNCFSLSLLRFTIVLYSVFLPWGGPGYYL